MLRLLFYFKHVGKYGFVPFAETYVAFLFFRINCQNIFYFSLSVTYVHFKPGFSVNIQIIFSNCKEIPLFLLSDRLGYF